MIRYSSRALRPFVVGRELPYREDGVLVTAASPREGVTFAIPSGRSNCHTVTALAVAWTPGRAVIGARWLCGGGSIGVIPMRPADLDRKHYVYPICQKCAAIQDGDAGPVVYRVWDKSGERLLYIGSTVDWIARRQQHRASTWWWPIASQIHLEHYPSIDLARRAEADAIRAERPRMNIQHNREVAS